MIEQNEVARVLRDAADLIEPPGRWTQGAMARDANGDAVSPGSADAVCWCADGAMERCSPGLDVMVANQAWMEVFRREGSPVLFNDTPSRTSHEVVALLRRVADKVESS